MEMTTERLNMLTGDIKVREYVDSVLTAAGFFPVSYAHVVLRNEMKVPVDGHLFVARKVS